MPRLVTPRSPGPWLLALAALGGTTRALQAGALAGAVYALGQHPTATTLAAFALAAAGVLILDRAAEYLEQKRSAAKAWDGLVVVPLDDEGVGLWRRLDRWLDARLRPVTPEAETLVVTGAEVRLDRTRPCGVCGEALGAARLVRCTECAKLHHQECFEYSGACARYGCGAPGGEELPEVPAAPAAPGDPAQGASASASSAADE